MKLFSGFSKDYNNLLEKILDRKTFSSLSKNLLSSMIYKLEISYKDYKIVKPNFLTKDEFFMGLLDVIQKYCDNIKIVEPESVDAELLIKHNVEAVTNTKERSILLYPTEQAMLYAISDIEPKYFFAKKDFIFKNVLQKVLVDGYKQNTMEILRNFNGWSWDTTSKLKLNYIPGLIYQNLLMIKEEKFLMEWRTDNLVQKNYLSDLKHSIKIVTENDNYYLSFCKILYMIADKKEKLEITKKLKENNKKYYQEILNNDKSLDEQIVEFQRNFLIYLEKKIEKMYLSEDILKMIYFLRYYQNIRINENVLIRENKELVKILDSVMKLCYTKACKMGVLKIICADIQVNFDVLKYVLDTKIIDLEQIRIFVEFENDEIFVKVYDKEVFEKQGKTIYRRKWKRHINKKK